MGNKKPAGRGSKIYEVGRGRPPVDKRWKPGQSGNPKGRPKGHKNPDTILWELLEQKVQIREKGKIRSITMLEAILRKLVQDAVRGDHKARMALLEYSRLPRSAQPASEPADYYTEFSEDSDRARRAQESYLRMIKGGRT